MNIINEKFDRFPVCKDNHEIYKKKCNSLLFKLVLTFIIFSISDIEMVISLHIDTVYNLDKYIK